MTNSPPGRTDQFDMKMIEIEVPCENHGLQVVQRIHSIGGEVFKHTRAPACPKCEKEESNRKVEARKAAEHRERIDRLIESACIPRRFDGKTFADFQASGLDQRRALDIVQKYAEAITTKNHTGDWLVLTGLPGTGKTLLAAALTRYLAESGQGVLYTTQSEMARDFRRSYQRDAEFSEPELFDHLSSRGVLVIDEIGVSTSEHIERLLFEISDARYAGTLPTVFVTNHTRKDLAGVIGERLYDRMCEVATFVSFNWPSVRASARRASIDHAANKRTA